MTDPTPDHDAPAPAREGRNIQVEICRRIALGESLRAITADPGMPGKSTVFEWLAGDREFRQAYGIAKAFLAETFAEEIIEISDDGRNDWFDQQRGDGASERVVDHEHIQRSRLRVDSRKWLAAKLSPKKYGDASTLHIGDTGEPGREISHDDRMVRLASMMAEFAERNAR
ncbi:hypothetical protein BH10PSE12_BH10PSE12_18890 [soil metagenome]